MLRCSEPHGAVARSVGSASAAERERVVNSRPWQADGHREEN